MSGSTPRILVVGDDYYASLATVRGLRRAGYEPWFATHSQRTFAARSRATAGTFALPHPSDGDEAYVAALVDAARRCSPAAVLPCNELAIKALPGSEERFPAGTVVGTSPREVVVRATDKAVLARLAADVGLAAPPTLELSVDEVEARAGEISFPAVVKPATSAVSLSGQTWIAPPARLVEDRPTLERALALQTRSLVQPFLDGALTAAAGVAWKGEVVCSAHQVARRIFPAPLGVSAYAETVPVDRGLDARLGEIVRRLGLSGIFEFQLIRTARASHVIDLNPRPYGSMALAIGAGLNLPAIWTDLLLGREPRIGAFRPGVRYRAEVREGRALAAALRGGRPARALAIARPRRRTVHSIFSLRDPAPALVPVERLVDRIAAPLHRLGGLPEHAGPRIGGAETPPALE